MFFKVAGERVGGSVEQPRQFFTLQALILKPLQLTIAAFDY